MDNMPYKIRYGAMDAVLIETDNRLSDWYDNLENIQNRVAKFSEMNSFSGKTADSVKSYLSEIYTVINMGLGQAISDYQSKFLLYKNGYYDIESNIYAVMTASTMKWYFDRSAERQDTQESLQERVNTTLSSIADLIYLPRPSSYTLLSDLDTVKTMNSELAEGIDNYENAAVQGDLEELNRLIANVTKVIRAFKEDGHRIGNYKSGDYLQNMAVLDMARSVMESQNYVAENKNRIEEASKHQNEVYDQMRADYEEACRQAAEARADKGGAEIVMGVVAVGVGVVCIVATAGAATPAVVAVGVTAGAGTTAYGLSQVVEGGQDVYYGLSGDISSTSVNPIRDTVFGGNQTAYNIWGTLNMTVAGIMIPGGKIVDNAVLAGATKAELAKTVSFTLVKELAIDGVSDEIAGNISSHVQKKYGWGETATTILNLGLSFGIEKGIDTAFDAGYNKLKSGDSFDKQMYSGDAQRYNQWMDEHSGFAGQMDAEDAARYNVWRAECEAGTHNNHPGLSDYDIQQWNVADSHVQEQIALNKIDADTYLQVRAEANGRYGTADIDNYKNTRESKVIEFQKEMNKLPHPDIDVATKELILEIERGKRMLPEHYLTPEEIDTHLKMFDNGVVKLQSKESYTGCMTRYGGTIGDPDTGTFVMPKDLVQKAIDASDGDPRVLENLLSLEEGYLGDSPVIVTIDKPSNIRMPSGNEKGAWDGLWVPGGFTKGGIPEAVIDQVKPGQFSVTSVFDK